MTRIAVALLLAFAVGLAACGDDSEDIVEISALSADATDTEDANTDVGIARPTEGASVMEGPDTPPPVEGEPTVTASGLQIIDIEVGSGASAEAGGTVTVHYTGWLADGTKFDSSLDRGTPATFALTGVIQGWQEGIPGMQVGGKRRLIIPPELAYGEQGSGDVIPPNAELTFDVELLDVP